jgi:hypothetical protein
MSRISSWLLMGALLAAVPVAAQVQSRPTDPPLVTADNESWYIAREPIQYAGDLYYPAGAAVFFNGNSMARAGHYNGVPLYADTTVEPYSVVLVPISRGLMQPYERLRDGNFAGTTGSRAPSFPVQITSTATGLPMAAVPPMEPPRPIGAISAYTSESLAPAISIPATILSVPSFTPTPVVRRETPIPITSLIPPESNDGLWIRYLGERWVSAGSAVQFTPTDFRQVGDYAGFPVYARQGTSEQVIYLPTRAGLVAPYRLKQ